MGVNEKKWWKSTAKVVPECSARLLLCLALIKTDVNLEGSKVLVEEVLSATRTTGGFPAKSSTKG